MSEEIRTFKNEPPINVFPEEVVDRYVNEFPFFCPYCLKERIMAHGVEVEFNFAWQRISCEDCKRQWFDVFKLVDIEEILPGQ